MLDKYKRYIYNYIYKGSPKICKQYNNKWIQKKNLQNDDNVKVPEAE